MMRWQPLLLSPANAMGYGGVGMAVSTIETYGSYPWYGYALLKINSKKKKKTEKIKT